MPSLYETTAAVGEVSSSNFTTLYNSSGLSAPNTGGGAVSGNLNIAGNLTVQGTSLLQGAVTLGSSLSLPGFTMPTGDGSTDQVIVTNGSGQLSWASVQTLPGASYTIQADTTTGGANLSLVSSLATDSVKFAGGTNITVSRTDASTITISTVADNIPDGTAAGQVLEWDGSAWTANNVVTALTPTGRLVAEYKDNTTSVVSSFGNRRNTGSTPFTTGTISSSIYQLDSDSQAVTSFGSMGFAYDASNPIFAVATSTDNFSTRTFIANIDKTEVKFNGTNLTLNYNGTTSAGVDAGLTVERGTSGGDATFKWIESNLRWQANGTVYTAGNFVADGPSVSIDADATAANVYLYMRGTGNYLEWNNSSTKFQFSNALGVSGAIDATGVISTTAESISMNTDSTATDSYLNFKGFTQYLKWNNASNRFELSNALQVGGDATVLGNYSQTGESMTINSDSTLADSFLYMKGSTEYLKWNNTDTRFELSDQLYISQTEPVAVFERKVTTAEVSPSEAKGAIRLLERVTDAASNATDDAGPSVNFGRTYGASGGTERLFASMGSVWYGTTNKAKLQFNWSTDDFTEPTPGVFPQTYTLLSLDSDYAEFFNNSLYVDYAHVDSTKTATSITGGNTLVFGSAHGYSAGDRILYQTATQNGLIQSTYYYVLAAGLTSTQCRVSNQSGGTAVTLTNGTGLTLTFAQVSNRIGVNTTTPGYTLDVDGDVNVTGDIYISGYQIDINSPAAGQTIIFDGTKFANSSNFEFTDFINRSRFINDSSTAGSISAAEFLKRRSSLSSGQGVGQLMGQIVGTTPTYSHRLMSQYDSGGNNQYLIQIDPTGNFASGSTTITSQLAVDNNDLYLAPANITLNANGTTSAGIDAGLTVERGTSGADATFKWINGNLRWEANGSIYTAGNLIADGPNIQVDADSTATESYLYMRGTSEYLKYNNSLTQFEFNNDLDVTGNVNANSVTIDDTRAKIDTGNSTTWATGTTITLTTTDKNLEKAMFYITDGTDVHAVEALVLRNGATAMLTTYGEMYSSSALATFTADISGGALRIRGTNTTATTLTVSIVATSLL